MEPIRREILRDCRAGADSALDDMDFPFLLYVQIQAQLMRCTPAPCRFDVTQMIA
ncbi:hypothetical protein GCM10009611_15970 [Arthrobacter roseus]